MKSATLGATTTTYGYDGLGKRLVADAGPATAEVAYTWDANASLPLLVRESDGTGALLRRYSYGTDLVSMLSAGRTSYFHHDRIGSVVATSTDSAIPERLYSYEPFGTARANLQLDPQAAANPMRFTGELLDGTGLYHLRARQYDPRLGRFTATDPLAPPQSQPYLNTYAYANDQPTLYVDRSGMSATLEALAFINVGVSAISSALNLGSLLGPYSLLEEATITSFVSTFISLASVSIAFAEEESGSCIASALSSYLGSTILSLLGAIPGTGRFMSTAKSLLSGIALQQSVSTIDTIGSQCNEPNETPPESIMPTRPSMPSSPTK